MTAKRVNPDIILLCGFIYSFQDLALTVNYQSADHNGNPFHIVPPRCAKIQAPSIKYDNYFKKLCQ
jgi:hypothetical protein